MAKPALPSPPRVPPTKTWFQDRWQFLSLPLLFFITLPLLALLVRTPPSHLLLHLKDPQVLRALQVSLVTTIGATVLIILLGTPVALLLARRRLPFRQVIDTLIDLPTVLPPAVAGVALLMTFGRRGLLGNMLNILGIEIAFTQTAVILAQIFIAAPFYVRAATLGFGNIDPELEQAAALDGANSWQAFRFVMVPLSWKALVSGSMMSWARALGEFGATIIFAGNFPGITQTMPLAIYIGFEVDLEVALTLSVILLLLSFLSLIIVKGILGRQITT
ncbi:MAG: ABC transporter permease [Omnitrophica WOR_2 bacterium]